MRSKYRLIFIVFLLIPFWEAGAISVSDQEHKNARRWVAAKFQGITDTRQNSPYMIVERGTVIKNTRYFDYPMIIGQTQYDRGIHFPEPGRLRVSLPSPGHKFFATIGLDNNEETKSGVGSAVFAVSVSEEERFRSEVVRLETPEQSVQVNLGGATGFVLEVNDGGDGKQGDQCDWGNARVTLADGCD